MPSSSIKIYIYRKKNCNFRSMYISMCYKFCFMMMRASNLNNGSQAFNCCRCSGLVTFMEWRIASTVVVRLKIIRVQLTKKKWGTQCQFFFGNTQYKSKYSNINKCTLPMKICTYTLSIWMHLKHCSSWSWYSRNDEGHLTVDRNSNMM